MFILENKNVIILFINKKIFHKIIFSYFKTQIHKLLKTYLISHDDSYVSKIIEKIIDKDKIDSLRKNIGTFLDQTNSNLKVSHIIEYYLNEESILDAYLDIDGFQEFFYTLSVHEIFMLLRINDYFKYTNEINTQDKDFRKINKKNNIIYMKWRKY